MAQGNDLTSLNGLFKIVYADKLQQIIPDGVKLLKDVKFISNDKRNGANYEQPVVLGLEHGVTFATAGDAFTLNNAVAGTIKTASVQGSQIVLRSVLSYTAAARALAGGPQAFESATKFLVGNMLRSMAKKLEIEMLYGGMGYGVVASVASNVLTMTTAEWASGIWAGAEGMPLDVRTSGGTSRGTCNVVSVDMTARTVTVDTAPVGTAATDVLYHSGAYGNEFKGLHSILTEATSLFGIAPSSYNLWKGNQYDCGGAALSFTKVTSAIALAVEKGLDEDVVILVSPKTWSNLLSSQDAARRYDSSYNAKMVEEGASSIKFHGQNGIIDIQPSIYVKEGYAYITILPELLRVGSTDITFKRPGNGEEFFRDLENAAGYELRAFADMALFTACPGKMILLKNIVNS